MLLIYGGIYGKNAVGMNTIYCFFIKYTINIRSMETDIADFKRFFHC